MKLPRITKDETYGLLIWYFLFYEDNPEIIGELLFLYKDTYGLPIRTLKDAVIDCVLKYADEKVDLMFQYISKKENEKYGGMEINQTDYVTEGCKNFWERKLKNEI